MTASVRIGIGVLGDTDPVLLARTVTAATRSLAAADDIMLIAERSDVAAQNLVARELARPDRTTAGRIGSVSVADLSDGGVLRELVAKPGPDGRSPTFCALIEPGVEMQATGLDDVRRGLTASTDLVYADSFVMEPEDTVTLTSSVSVSQETVLRPAWSPDRLRTQLYLGPFVAYRSSLIAEANPTTAHDLALWASERARSITHVPAVVASAPAGGGWAMVDPEAVQRHLDRTSAAIAVADDLVEADRSGGESVRLEPSLDRSASVSIVILTGGATREVGGRTVLLVANALASILVAQPDPDVEIIVVVDAASSEELGRQLQALDPERIRIVKDKRPFNFSAANNLGVASARGELLVFFNDDAEVLDAGWLDRIRMHLADPAVGVVGARLLFGDGRVQHAGLVVRDGWVEHRFGGYPNDHTTVPAPLENIAAVTGACFAMRREHFDELGGFGEDFPLNFNDVDLCFASRATGRRVVLDHALVLTHHETSSREPGITDDEQRRFNAKWTNRGVDDPYDHPAYVPVRAQPQSPPPALARLRRALHEPSASRSLPGGADA